MQPAQRAGRPDRGLVPAGDVRQGGDPLVVPVGAAQQLQVDVRQFVPLGVVQGGQVRDVAVRITPLTDRDASEMVRSLATFPLLDGYRNAPRVDVAALEETLLRVSAMVEAHPEIVEMDCSPLMVLERGVVVVDARIRIELPQAR